MRRQTGFTLIEILVVTAIVAILSAMLGMTFFGLKAAAKKSACAFSLREAGVGVTSYLTDYDGMYPQMKGQASPHPELDDRAGAIELPDRGFMLKHLGSYTTGLVPCPSDIDPDAIQCSEVPGVSPDVNSYLVNAYFVFGLNECQLPGAASTVFVAERRSTAVDNVPPNCDVIFRPWYNPANPDAPRNDMDEKTGAIASTRHQGGANYLFADDHCETLPFDRVWGPPNNDMVDLYTP